MKRIIIWLLLIQPYISHAQNNIVIELPEVYELSNIALSLTKYGLEDKWEVQKGTTYYKEVQEFFAPVKDHPLLDSINYSRKRWEDYLSFRTDAYAFSFGADEKLNRNIPFSSVENHLQFDQHLTLINDFVKKSNFREFYKNHLPFYTNLINHYKQYYYIDKMKLFLDKAFKKAGATDKASGAYKIVISPLVGRMNCHRNIDSLTAADFPNLSTELMEGKFSENSKERIVEAHTIFTEMDHAYVNPVSDNFKQLIIQNFDTLYWDKASGYGLDCFNEYMTWSLYDIFIKELFPESADSIALQWHFQNITRGFIASNVFADRVKSLYAKYKSVQNLYQPLLMWTKMYQSNIKSINVSKASDKDVLKVSNNKLDIKFTDALAPATAFDVLAIELKDGKETGNSKVCNLDHTNRINWSNDNKQVSFDLKVDYKNYYLVFNWWGVGKPLFDPNKILLKPIAYVTVEGQ